MKTFFLILALLCAQVGRAQVLYGTYYIDNYQGNDTNSGKSTNAPWQHQPWFANSTVTNYIHTNGDQFIFRGGVTNGAACFGSQFFVPMGGSTSFYDHWMTTNNWYLGNTWQRAIMDGGSTSVALFVMNLVNGGSGGQWQCCINFDSLEMRNIRLDATDGGGLICGSDYGYVTITNCDGHNWCQPGSSSGESGGYIASFGGGFGATNLFIYGGKIHNEEQGISNRCNGNCEFQYNVINDVEIYANAGACLYFAAMTNDFLHDLCTPPYEDFDVNAHPNPIYTDHALGSVETGPWPDIWVYGCTLSNYNGTVVASPEQSHVIFANDIFEGPNWPGNGAIDADPGGQYTGVTQGLDIDNCTFIASTNPIVCVNVTSRSGQQLAFLQLSNNVAVTTNGLQNYQTGQAVSFSQGSNYISGINPSLAPNFAPLPGSVVIGAGVDLSALFRTDASGSMRTDPWSQGYLLQTNASGGVSINFVGH